MLKAFLYLVLTVERWKKVGKAGKINEFLSSFSLYSHWVIGVKKVWFLYIQSHAVFLKLETHFIKKPKCSKNILIIPKVSFFWDQSQDIISSSFAAKKPVLWLADLSGLPIRGLFFWQKTTWTHDVQTRISEKTDFSV